MPRCRGSVPLSGHFTGDVLRVLSPPHTHVSIANSDGNRLSFNAFTSEQMSVALNADMLFAYVGIVTTATASIYAGSFGSLPVSQSSLRDLASLFNSSSSLGMMPRSRKVTQSARMMMMTRTRTIPFLG